MNLVQNVGLYTVGGALIGAGLTTISKISITAREQYQGSLIGASSACAMSLVQPIIAKVGTHFHVEPRKITMVQVAAHCLVTGVAMAAFQTAELLNAPTKTLFGLIASIEPSFLLCDF